MTIDSLRSPLNDPSRDIRTRCEHDERVTYTPPVTCQFPGCTYPAGLTKDRAFVEFQGKVFCELHIGLVKLGEIVKPCQCGGDDATR